jgi:phosphoribosylamine--glycine ligase
MEKNQKINVLVVGSGGREHALAWKISNSPLLNKLYLAGANDGFKPLGAEIKFTDYDELAKISKEKNVELAVIGPEQPLSEGIADVFQKYGIKCIGANQKWARLESSKAFAKAFMQKHDIPTAAYELITNASQIDEVLKKFSRPPVLKADGLAAGKGVYLPESFEDAKSMLKDFLDGKFGEASKSVVVEEFLEGVELSVISIFDGKSIKTFIPARDHKRLLDKNLGPNTGGMGAYCPVKISGFHRQKLDEYLKALENALLEEEADFCGIVYSGLMLTDDAVKVLEYNMRFGDPETQPLMMHLKSDILEIFINAANQTLSEINTEWNEGSAFCVVLAAQGYPESPKKGSEIRNVEETEREFDVKVFFAGVKYEDPDEKSSTPAKQDRNNGAIQSGRQRLLANGGRVLCVCATGSDEKETRERVYKACEKIDFSDKIFRTDIGVNYERTGNYSRF